MKKISKGVKKQLLNLLFVAILISITLAVLLASNRELNFENIGAFLAQCNPFWITAAFICMLLFILFEGISLHIIARRLGHKGKFLSSIAYSAADTYYSAITPSATGGQPASAFYMTRDGMGAGKATFSLIFNLIGYTAAIIVLAIAAIIMCPALFTEIDAGFAKFLVIAGGVAQVLLLAFFIACMFCGKAVLKLGNGIISFLCKIKLVKKTEKWREKLAGEVDKYGKCRGEIKKYPGLFAETLLFNVLQRVSQTLIPCFVCLSAGVDVSFFNLFAMQVFVLLGYNCVPLPGGVGAYEFLYISVYSLCFEQSFIVVAMMISRMISYYFCIVVSGIYTLSYHLAGTRRAKTAPQAEEAEQSLPE